MQVIFYPHVSLLTSIQPLNFPFSTFLTCRHTIWVHNSMQVLSQVLALYFMYIILFIHLIYWGGRTHIFYMAFLWSSLVTSPHRQPYQISSKSRYQPCLTVGKANKSNTFEVRTVRMVNPLIITALPLQREKGRACDGRWRHWPVSLCNQTQSFWHQYINAKWFINTAGDEGTGLSTDSDRGGW